MHILDGRTTIMSTRPPPREIIGTLIDIWERLWDVKISGVIEATIPHTVTVQATDLDIRDITETIPVNLVIDNIGLLKPGQTINVTATSLDIRQITETIPVSRVWTITETIPTSIVQMPFKGTPYRYYNTIGGTIITVAAGQQVRIYGYYIAAVTDEVVTLEYTDGDKIAILPSKGVAAMNLVNINESNTVSVRLTKDGTGYALAVVYAEVS